jgi:hypothetical protein
MVSKSAPNVRLFRFLVLTTLVLWTCGLLFDNWLIALCSLISSVSVFFSGMSLAREYNFWVRDSGAIQWRGIVALAVISLFSAAVLFLLPDDVSWSLTFLSVVPAWLLAVGLCFAIGSVLVMLLYKPQNTMEPSESDRLGDFASPLFYLALSLAFFAVKPAPYSYGVEQFMGSLMLFLAWLLFIIILLKNKWIVDDNWAVQGMGLVGLASVTAVAFLVGVLVRSSPDYDSLKLVIVMMVTLGLIGSLVFAMMWRGQRRRAKEQ